MPINIKELYKSDLDSNSTIWWSEDKIDKINHNFRQLISGGMIGPVGNQGAYGASGGKGLTGDQGPQGPVGVKGVPGIDGLSFWHATDGLASGSIHLYTNPTGLIEYTPIPLGIGYAPSVQSAYSYYGGFLNINSYSGRVNFSLKSGALKSEHRLYLDGGEPVYEYGRIRSGASGLHNRVKLRTNDTFKAYTIFPGGSVWNESLTIKPTLISTRQNLDFRATGDFKVLKDARINQGSALNYVLTSTDSTGKSLWADPKRVIPGYKYGMVISIPSFLFNSTNFELDVSSYIQTDDGLVPPTLDPIRFKFGRGRIGTSYEGWYLCNGQKWNSLPGVNETQVPNLNQVHLEIDSSPDQPSVNVPSKDSILGGHPISIRAQITGNKYDIFYDAGFLDNNDNTETIKIREDIPGSSPKTFDLTQMVHLIKLDRNDLEWESSSAMAPSLTDIILSGEHSSYSIACLSTATTTYSWDAPAGTDWATLDTATTDYKIYDHNTFNFAPTGYYQKDNVARYWDKNTGTLTTSGLLGGACPLFPAMSLEYGSTVQSVNYSISSPNTTYVSDSNVLASATFLWKNNAYAQTGWYCNGGFGVNRVRRYWDQASAQFLGDTLYSNYALRVQASGGLKPIRLSKSLAPTSTIPSACSDYATAPSHELFMMIDNAMTTSLLNIKSYAIHPTTSNGRIYANKDWVIPTNPGEAPLVRLRSQLFPGSSNAQDVVRYLVDGDGTNSDTHLSINTDNTPGIGGDCQSLILTPPPSNI